MPRRTDISAILAIGAALAAGRAVAQVPTIVAPRSPTPEESREYLRLEAAAQHWADAARSRHRPTDASCSIAVAPTPRSACTFRLDGISLVVWKHGRAASAAVGAHLDFGNGFERRGDRLVVTAGAWIRPGDLLEVEAGRTVYPLPCETLGPPEFAIAQCILARDFAQLGGRARYPAARYRYNSEAAEAALGRAFAAGSIRIFHNGREISSAALTGAARDFARQDFDRLAAR